MATIVAGLSPNYSGFHTDTFFIPGLPDAQVYTRILAGGGASVTVTYPDLGLRYTYSGSNLAFFGTAALAGQVTQIQVAQYDSFNSNYRPIGTLTLPAATSWSFAQVFTTGFAQAYLLQSHHISGTERTDTLVGGNLDDVIRGESHNDLIFAGAGNDVLELRVQGPWDSLPAPANLHADMGSGTADVLRILPVAGAVNLRDATLIGFDEIEFMGASRLHLDATDLGVGVSFDAVVRSNGGTLVLWQGADRPLSVRNLQVTGTLIVDVVGTEGGDVQLGGFSSFDILRGGGSGDWLRGLALADTLYGGAGNDTLDGGGGVDHLQGDDGDDTYRLTAGDVIVEGVDGGTDTVQAYADTVLTANVEHVEVMGSPGRQIIGNDLGNYMSGAAGNDTFLGEAGNDIIAASGGEDSLRGGWGNDTLNGGAGNDMVRGDRDDDWLAGFTGNDTLTGGDGADRFLFATGYGTDRIRDFATNGDVEDVIDLIDLASITSWVDLVTNHMSQQGLNVVINAGGGDVLILERVWLPLLQPSDFLF